MKAASLAFVALPVYRLSAVRSVALSWGTHSTSFSAEASQVAKMHRMEVSGTLSGDRARQRPFDLLAT